MSPFCVLATSGADGSVDASPRGGNPGFIHVAGPNLLLMPDRSGNNPVFLERTTPLRRALRGDGARPEEPFGNGYARPAFPE